MKKFLVLLLSIFGLFQVTHAFYYDHGALMVQDNYSDNNNNLYVIYFNGNFSGEPLYFPDDSSNTGANPIYASGNTTTQYNGAIQSFLFDYYGQNLAIKWQGTNPAGYWFSTVLGPDSKILLGYLNQAYANSYYSTSQSYNYRLISSIGNSYFTGYVGQTTISTTTSLFAAFTGVRSPFDYIQEMNSTSVSTYSNGSLLWQNFSDNSYVSFFPSRGSAISFVDGSPFLTFSTTKFNHNYSGTLYKDVLIFPVLGASHLRGSVINKTVVVSKDYQSKQKLLVEVFNCMSADPLYLRNNCTSVLYGTLFSGSTDNVWDTAGNYLGGFDVFVQKTTTSDVRTLHTATLSSNTLSIDGIAYTISGSTTQSALNTAYTGSTNPNIGGGFVGGGGSNGGAGAGDCTLPGWVPGTPCANVYLSGAVLSTGSNSDFSTGSMSFGSFKGFTCPSFISGMITMKISNIPGLSILAGTPVDVDLFLPITCLYASYIQGTKDMAISSYPNLDAKRGSGRLLEFNNSFYNADSSSRSLFLVILNLFLIGPAVYLFFKAIK